MRNAAFQTITPIGLVIDAVTTEAERWRQTDEVRRFLAALERHQDAAGILANGKSVSGWLAWAHARLAAFDPMTAVPVGVFEDD